MEWETNETLEIVASRLSRLLTDAGIEGEITPRPDVKRSWSCIWRPTDRWEVHVYLDQMGPGLGLPKGQALTKGVAMDMRQFQPREVGHDVAVAIITQLRCQPWAVQGVFEKDDPQAFVWPPAKEAA